MNEYEVFSDDGNAVYSGTFAECEEWLNTQKSINSTDFSSESVRRIKRVGELTPTEKMKKLCQGMFESEELKKILEEIRGKEQ